MKRPNRKKFDINIRTKFRGVSSNLFALTTSIKSIESIKMNFKLFSLFAIVLFAVLIVSNASVLPDDQLISETGKHLLDNSNA